MPAPKLELRNVRKQFGNFRAVSDVSMEIGAGECWVFLGPSGCGKTTTLRMIAGFLQPDAGSIRIEGQQIAGEGVFVPPYKRGIGMVFQSYAVWPHKTVYENVAYGLRIRRVPREEEKRRVAEALSLVHLSKLADRYPSMLSGGQQQRVSLARAIVIQPTILLLDEPLSNLDARLREQMRFDLKELQNQLRLTTIYVTHDQAEAMVIADKIIVMENGSIVQIGPPEEIYGHPRTRFVADFVGESNLLPGRIEATDGASGGFTIRVADIGELHLHSETAVDRPTVGQAGYVCVRPEDISLVPAAGGVNGGWRGAVTAKTYLGAGIDYRVRVGGHELRASLHRTVHLDPGEPVIVQLNPGQCAWLPG